MSRQVKAFQRRKVIKRKTSIKQVKSIRRSIASIIIKEERRNH